MERALHEAILERVEAEDRDATRPARTMPRQRREQRLELLELAVHRDAQRLERARRRIDAADARRADRAHDRAAQIERRLELVCRRAPA